MTATAPCITVSMSSPASTPTASTTQQLSQLSRNASVISTSSSSSASSVINTPQTRPRPLRQFSYQPPSRPRSPVDQSSRARSPSRPPVSPSTPRGSRVPPPVWLPRELGRADSDDSDSALPELAPSSRRGSDARARAHSRKGSLGTVRRADQADFPPLPHSRAGSVSDFPPPASPKNAPGLLAGSPKLGQRALAGPGKRSRVPSTASSAAVLAGQLEAIGGSQVQASSNLNPNAGLPPISRTTAPSPTPPPTGRKRRTQSTSTTGAKARSRSTSAAPRQRQPVSAADFEFGSELGSGSYSTVVKAWFKGNTGASSPGIMGGLAGVAGTAGEGKVYAVKVSDKQYLINKGKVKYANVEKSALALLGAGNQHRGHPGIVKLHWTFHDPTSLYFVLDLVPNGELLDRIKKLGSFTSEGARYYTAQIVDAVGWMHGMGVVHRDLKPENVLLDEAFRVRITDFGSARIEGPEGPGTNPSVGPSSTNGGESVAEQRASSFVGTAEYVSPELLIHNVTSRSSDVWAIGCILFQMLAGRPPFKGGSEYLTLEQVKRLEYVVPEHFDPLAEELVRSMLVLDPAARPTTAAIRSHAFFAETAWEDLWTCPAPPMESGPCKGPPEPEPPVEFESDEDVGDAWDRMVDGNQDGDEEGSPKDLGAYLTRMGYFGGGPKHETTPRPIQRPNYNFQDYKFGGDASTVPIPTTEEGDGASNAPAVERSLLLAAGLLHAEPAPMGSHSRPSIPPSLPPILSPSLDPSNEIAVEDDDMVPELQPTEQRVRTDPLRASHSSTVSGAGTTSSSEGSPLGSASGAGRTGSGERMPIAGGDVEGLRIALAVMGLGGDSERLSSALAPGEKPVFMSSILSRPRHRLTAVLPSKRRILVLTDTPRLLCVKEERNRVVVKSALLFSGTGAGPKPPQTIPNGRGRSIARWKPGSSSNTGSVSGISLSSVAAGSNGSTEADEESGFNEVIQNVETKGEKSFVVQTMSKAYTYVAENSEEATRWVQQIKAVQQVQVQRRRSSRPSTRPTMGQ